MTEIMRGPAERVVIVGSGLAGLMTALALAPRPVLLVTRSALGTEASSPLAQGGIAASLAADDSAELHLADTLVAGDGLCDPDIARGIIAEAPGAISALERLGVRFDRDASGALLFGLEAAHSRRRIVHAGGDATGAAVMRALVAAVRKTPSIAVLEGFEARRLVTEGSIVTGLLCANGTAAPVLPTASVVLATGGLCGLYDATTNPAGNIGQGIALAARAGAILADMEFVQFHPTALDSARKPLALISEAVRGEGARLRNERGEFFMERIAGGELASRDVVARAISAELARGGRVYLDAREALGNRFQSRFPAIAALCHEAGIDPTRDLIPVRPAAHYHMGGVATDAEGRSSVRGLWVAGEAASTGLHGANRLASNSLLEAAVMGLRVARSIDASAYASSDVPALGALPTAPDASAVRPIVSRHLGVLRDAAGLESAIAALLALAEGCSAATDAAAVALTMAVSAHLRTESRGAHTRIDYPAKDLLSRRRFITLAEALDSAHSLATPRLARSA
ncbi:L-aspartate oxidase [Rhizobium sp. BK251]|uniref:L-aspartate oxidase n=1 Tax=Rhizobium sp. BK251 TaxID=2512125 RepID=UPI00104E8617|nr:L-aspartate oxidase [Rhizobium sp. BK251]TCL71854.1 L-aspartate oxidase [Rhizobium sp. BK251]